MCRREFSVTKKRDARGNPVNSKDSQASWLASAAKAFGGLFAGAEALAGRSSVEKQSVSAGVQLGGFAL